MRRILLKLHRWAGLVSGVFVLVIAVTGALLIFDGNLDRLLNRRLLVVTPRSDRVLLQRVLESVREAHPRDAVTRIALPQQPDESIQVLFHSGLVASVDPYSGEILGIRDPEKSLARLILALHTTLLAGQSGRRIAGALTIVTLAMAVSGLVLWWPRRIFRVGRSPSWRRINFDLHNVIGFYSAFVLAFITLSGAMIAFREFTYPLILKLDSLPGPVEVNTTVAGNADTFTLDDAVRVADAALPGAKATAIYIPPRGRAGFRVAKKFPEDRRPMGRSSVMIDQYSGEVRQVVSGREAELGSRIVNLIRLLHIGDIAGTPSRIVAFLVCLMLAGQIVTGFLIWWRPGKLAFGAAGTADPVLAHKEPTSA